MVRNSYFTFFLLCFFVAGTTNAQNFIYSESFETNNPFQFWTANGTYQINYFGPSGDRAIDGTKSLKMDITVTGSGTRECTYYWKLPVKINLHGKMDFISYLWMDSETAKYVKLSYNYTFPPTTIQRSPATKTITQYNSWYSQSICLSDDVIYHADYFAKNKIYGSTYDDFGRELNFIQIAIKAVGTKRLVFYIDKLQLKGTVLTQSSFPDYYNSSWAAFQKRLTATKTEKHAQYNNLPPLPNTTGVTLTTKAQEYISKLNNAKISMNSLFTVIDNNEYFEPKYMDSLNTLLGLYPSWITLLKTELNNPSSALRVYSMCATEYNRLTETNIPCGLQETPRLQARVCQDEYEPFSLFLSAAASVNNIKVSYSGFSGPGGVIPSTALDVSIAKVWYQNGRAINGYDGKWLTQELLVKNDNLIKIDEAAKTNYLLVHRTDGTSYYQNISGPLSAVPRTVKIIDSKVLLPFSIPAGRSKQLWFTFHAPENIAPGKYKGNITITADNITASYNIPVEIDILPFKLQNPKLTYSIYYHGYVNDWSWENDPFTSFGKSSKQFLLEMKDLKEHGVLYPTTYQTLSNLHLDLELRNQAGLPKDMLFAAGFSTGNPTGTALTGLKNDIAKWKTKIAQYGYSDLHVYGIDEATGEWLVSQRPAWQAVHEAGAKVFASGYYKHFELVGDLLDVGVIQPEPRKEQADLYHSKGHKIFNYSNPMIGLEDPEVYRRNYGILLWKSGYDGVMNYAYQREFKDIWNDFDIETNQPHPYRDHCFTYPISDGILSTIQWEGFREGVDDVRYLSTLINKVDSLKKKGVDVASYESYINSIDPSQDLDFIREEIINKILAIQAVINVPDPTPASFSLTGAVLIDPTTLKLTFSDQVYSGIYSTGNYLIDNGVSVLKVVLSGKNEITLTTSPHTVNKLYNITVRNLKDPKLQIISATGNTAQYKYSTFTLSNALLVDPTTVKLTFTSQIYSGIYSTGNYLIDNGITVLKAVLTGKNEITLTTSAHVINKLFTITVRNLKDTSRIVIEAPGNLKQYSYSDLIVVKAETGTLSTGAGLKTQTGSISSKVGYFSSVSGTIQFKVNLPRTAVYYVWGRFYYSGVVNDPNSFSISVDGTAKYIFGNNKDYYNKWHWGGDGNQETGVPVKLSLGILTGGEHIVTVSGREIGSSVMFDMILLTTDAAFIPDDKNVVMLGKEEFVTAEIPAPDSYSLSQNFPNPFNPSTQIKFALPAEGHVTLKVFDILGKEVAVLVDDYKDAGYHQVAFNASNLPSGIYIYRIEANSFAQTRKMLLVK